MSSDPSAMLTAIEGATDDPHVIEAMLVGSYLESGWDPTAVGDGSYGPFQLQLNDGGYTGVTQADAEDPTFSADRLVGQYTTAAALVPAALWASNPEEASEETAYGAEKPQVNYYQGQGTAKVNEAWAATKLVLVNAKTPVPQTATLTGITSVPGDVVGAVGDVVGGGVEKSVASIAGTLLAVAAGLGLVVLGAYKTASPGGSITQDVGSAVKTGAKGAETAGEVAAA